MYGPDGVPKGVSTVRSLRSTSSAISYKPLPPTIPISIRSLIPSFSFVLSHVGRRHRGVVFEEYESVLLRHVCEERLLRGERVHWVQVVAHDPRIRQMGRRWHEIGR